MRKRLTEKFTRAKRGSLGYTMTELLVVIAIIAIVCAIAIPSIFAIRNMLNFAKANNYAKSIFLAAQQNLTEMRSDGGLEPVQSAGGAFVIPGEVTTFPDEFRAEYVYTTTGTEAFKRVLPAGSVDAELLNDQIVIEYNPTTGNVYAVFYYEKDMASLDLAGEYADGSIPREKDDRRELMVGYYDGSGLNSSQIELEQTQASVNFINGEEGIVQVKIPMPDSFYGDYSDFAEGLNIMLTISGEWTMAQPVPEGEAAPQPLTLQIKTAGDVGGCYLAADGRTVVIEYAIDSLASRRSFVNFASGTQEVGAGGAANTAASLTTILSEDSFTYNILPGENITIQADVTFTGSGSEMVQIDPGILSGVNPMFDYLQPIGNGSYVLAVANGRNLQNLNAIAPTIADMVANVVFTSDIYWNDTVAYYNSKYANGSTYNTGSKVNGSHVYDEAPARALPYFVPIHNEYLFGTARFIFPGDGDGGLGDIINSLLGGIFGRYNDSAVPTLTDEMDNGTGVSHATIQGDGHAVYNINIDSTKYQVPNEGKKTTVTVNGTTAEKDLTGTFYATGENQIVDYCFTGLFGYVNTPITSMRVVNPIVKGLELKKESTSVPNYIFGFPFGTKTVNLYNNPATGALLGAGGFNTVITDCSTYVDKNARGYMNLEWGPFEYSADGAQNWYGVSGTGSVGGLVGYAKSHRSVTGELTDDEAHLAFSNCFAAVPVSSVMRTETDKNFGYSNGVGSFIGNSQLTNFYRCYASGDVLASGCRVGKTLTGSLGSIVESLFGVKLDLPYDGRTSWGAGGFVGTSHGTRYTNCFSTGNVSASSNSSSLGAGGFVGFMSIDETFTYGNKDSEGNETVAQRTVFTNCYSVGVAVTNGATYENFSGANGRVAFKLNTSMTYYVGDYFRLYAPHYVNNGGAAPDYEDVYVYRDTYFMSSYHSDVSGQDSSSHCASPDTYASFTDMVGNHTYGSQWMQDEIQKIKDISLTSRRTYDTQYFQVRPELNDIYLNLYSEGYSADDWESATASTTHPYSLTEGSRYPFTKLKGMDYYGDWPSKPSDMGMAYYETYQDTGKTHYFFDKNHSDYESLSLRSGANVMVTDDGYSIFSADNSDLVVTVGNVTEVLSARSETYTVAQKTYHVFQLTDTLMAQLADEGEFYIMVAAQHVGSTNTYIMYFNPSVALSHVNPVEYYTSAVKPDAAPTTIYVRSARQFKGIATLDDFWGEEYRYIQQLNIDASVYQWAAGENDYRLASIGTDADQTRFNADYSAGYTVNVGSEEQYKISGFTAAEAGFFGAIGEKGSVSNLIIECVDFTSGSAVSKNAAVLAAVNYGSINNVDIYLSGNVSLTATTNAGLLAGQSSGSVTVCEVVVSDGKNVTISAQNAGGLIGSVEGTKDAVAVLNNVSMTLNGGLNVSGNAANAGGLIGKASYLSAEALSVKLNGLTGDAKYLGGLAGYTENSAFTGIAADANGANPAEVTAATIKSSNAEGYAAGGIGYAANTVLTAVDVTVGSVEGNIAAGFLGNSENADATNCDVVITGAITGNTGAAGVAGTLGSQSVFNDVPVLLRGVTIRGANAAGYALELKGDAYVMGNSHVTFGYSTDTKTTISATSNAAGFAVTTAGSIGDSNVIGFGSVSGEQAAGFAVTVSGNIANCHVSPALNNDSYLGNANASLAVSGKTAAAGFALTLNKNSTISNCYTLCSISSQSTVSVTENSGAATEGETTAPAVDVSAAYGFVGTNEGTINRCMANVDIVGGFAFVGVNNGLVTTSYGWCGDGDRVNATTTRYAMTGSGKCYSSYFADLAPVNRSDKAVALYDSEGNVSLITPSALQMVELSGFTTGYNEYPYHVMDASEADYPYPMLRDHYGNWITPPKYAYGVAYYEIYSDGTRKIRMVDLSNSAMTEEGQKNVQLLTDATFDNSGVITETGYATFYNSLMGEQENKAFDVTIGDFVFDFYKLEPGDVYTIAATQTGTKSAVVDRRFANAIKVNDTFGTGETFEIRTAQQLANIGQVAANYTQTHDITTVDVTSAAIGAGYTYNGNGLLLAISGQNNTWLTDVGGTVTALNLVIDVVPAQPVFGNVTGAVTNLTLTVQNAVAQPVFNSVTGTVSLNAVQIGSIAANGALVGTSGGNVTTGTITTGEIAANGAIFSSITGGAVTVDSITTSGNSVNGSVFSSVAGNVTVTNGITVGDVNGAVFGAVSGGAVQPGAITTGQIGTAEQSAKIFGDITGGSVVAGNIATGGKAVYGQVFGNVSAPVTVNDIQVGAVSGQIFGDLLVSQGVTGVTVNTGNITTNGNAVTGKIFGNSNIGVTVNDIQAGAITGQVFGYVYGSVTVSESLHVGTLAGKVFGDVGGYVTVNNADKGITVADVSACGANWLINSVSGGKVTLSNVLSGSTPVTTVTTGTDADGNEIKTTTEYYSAVPSLIGKITGGELVLGGVTVGNVSGNSGWLIESVDNSSSAPIVTIGNVTVHTGTKTVVEKVDGTAEPVTTFAYDSVSNMIGTISGGTVSGNTSGSTVELGGASISGNLFTGVSNGATLSSFAVNTSGNLTASLIGTASATISNVDVIAGGATIGADVYGLLVNTVEAGAAISSCDVKVTNAVTVIASTFGGITGEVPVNVTLTGNTVEATLNVTGATNTTTVVGGLVGKSEGTVDASALSKVTINYNQVEGDTAIIGGLIGQMDNGSLTGMTGNPSVSGSINLVSGTGTGRAYIIGGAVGAFTAGTAENTHVNVIVDTDWITDYNKEGSATFGISGIVNNGPVGMFVGFAGDVELKACSSTETTNQTYQFLGEAKLLDTALTNMWKSSVKNDSSVKAYSDSLADGEYTSYDPAGITFKAATSVTNVVTKLSDCSFQFGGVTKQQKYGAKDYIYSHTSAKENAYSIATDGATPKITSTEQEFSRRNYDKDEYVPTGKYYLKDGIYYPASVVFTEKSALYKMKFSIVETGNEGHVLAEKEPKLSSGQYRTTFTLYSFEVPTLNGVYVAIKSELGALDSQGNGYTIPENRSFETRDELVKCLWNVSGNTITNIFDSTVYTVNATIVTTGTPVMSYEVGGAVFNLYPVTVTNNGSAYDVLTFTNEDSYSNQFITAE